MQMIHGLDQTNEDMNLSNYGEPNLHKNNSNSSNNLKKS